MNSWLFRPLVLTVACLAAGGCSTFRPLPPPPDTTQVEAGEISLTYQGQLSIKLQSFGTLPAKGVSLGFFFQGSPRRGQLDLMTPLGSQVARIHWSPTHATLSSAEHGEQQFADLNELTAQVLGEAIPLPALMDWLQGHPNEALSPAVTGPDGFVQAGWQIDTSELANGKLQAARQQTDTLRGVLIRIRLDR